MTPTKGDVVVLPQHGLCVVVGRRRVSDGSSRVEHLILNVLSYEQVITLPVTKLAERGLRAPMSLDDFDSVLAVLSQQNKRISTMWSRRFKRNQALLNSGAILEVAAVVRNISDWSQKNPLSSAEQTMYDRAYTNLIAEMKHAAADFDIDVAGLVANALLSSR
jgi:CarD family transcriptional regulator